MEVGMERIRRFVEKYREQLAYLFFGGVATVVNIGVYGLMHGLMDVHSDLANAVAWAVSVAVAYVTNRKWVFRSRTRGRAMAREFGAFVAGRLITGLMDQGIMHLATQVVGPRFIPAAARKLWDMGVKVASNVLVIVLNYVFSKGFIFREKGTGNSRSAGGVGSKQ